MTFIDLLKEAGLSRSALSRHMRLNRTTVSRWADEPPGYGVAYAELYLENKKLKKENDRLTGTIELVKKYGTADERGKRRRPKV